MNNQNINTHKEQQLTTIIEIQKQEYEKIKKEKIKTITIMIVIITFSLCLLCCINRILMPPKTFCEKTNSLTPYYPLNKY